MVEIARARERERERENAASEYQVARSELAHFCYVNVNNHGNYKAGRISLRNEYTFGSTRAATHDDTPCDLIALVERPLHPRSLACASNFRGNRSRVLIASS